MKRIFLLVYQIGVACSDTLTGASLIIAPAFTLCRMGIVINDASQVYISYIGAFVLGIGLSCGYGALVLILRGDRTRVQMVWLLTAIVRGSVAVFVTEQVLSHSLAPGWIGVAVFDGVCALVQGIGLRQEWLNDGTC
ncbi:hypothetical protein ACOBR2_05330 [Telmatobacter bradus]|uniref:hypothetical protein n=1 Tax=Telmatobacter bradus TaxID=474953 RepID=UPI003B432A11